MGRNSKLDDVDDIIGSDAKSSTADAERKPIVNLDRMPATLRGIEKMAGGVVVKSIAKADAKLFTVFPYNARDFKKLTIEKCSDVIESIRSNGQQVPAIVRRNEQGILEVIAGSRRLFACRHLGIELEFVEIKADNKLAIRISMLENNDRTDTTPWEKYQSYQKIIAEEYAGKQKDFALDNNISESGLSRYMRFGDVPDAILDAYGERDLIPALHPEEIVKLLKRTPGSEKELIRIAAEISKGTHALLPEQILNRFRDAIAELGRKQNQSNKKIASPVEKIMSFGPSKKAKVELKITPTKITTLRLDKAAWDNREEAIKAVTRLLEEHFGKE